MKQLALSGINNVKNIIPINNGFNYAVLKAPVNVVKGSITEFLIKEKDLIVNWICAGIANMCDVGCVLCIVVCGLSILWFVIDQKGSTPRKYISGSFVFYIGIRLVQYIIS